MQSWLSTVINWHYLKPLPCIWLTQERCSSLVFLYHIHKNHWSCNVYKMHQVCCMEYYPDNVKPKSDLYLCLSLEFGSNHSCFPRFRSIILSWRAKHFPYSSVKWQTAENNDWRHNILLKWWKLHFQRSKTPTSSYSPTRIVWELGSNLYLTIKQEFSLAG